MGMSKNINLPPGCNLKKRMLIDSTKLLGTIILYFNRAKTHKILQRRETPGWGEFLGLSVTIWDYLWISATIWDYMGLSWTIWDHLGLSGTILDNPGLSGTIWDSLGLYGTIWSYHGLSGTVCDYLGLYGNILDYLGQYKSAYNNSANNTPNRVISKLLPFYCQA